MKKKLLITLLAAATVNAWAEDGYNPDVITITITGGSGVEARDASGSVSVIRHREIVQKGSANVLEAIRDTTGVNLQGVGTGGRKAISLRGMESKHTLLLINGKRVPASNDAIGPNTDYQYDWIPVEQIERIEVVRGPMSVLYGADALGGVINIITRQPARNATGTITLGGRLADGDQGGDGHALRFNLGGGVQDNLQLGLSGEQSRRSAVESQLTPGTSALEGREHQQLSFQADWQPAAGHNIELEHTRGREERWYDTATRTGTLYESRYDIERDQSSLSWKGAMGDTQASLRAYRSHVDITNQASHGVAPTSPQALQEDVADGSLIFGAGGNHAITTGFELRRAQLEHPSLSTGRDEAKTRAAYLQDIISLGQRTEVTFGVRWDKHDSFGSELSPRAALTWDAGDNLTLKASYGHGFRAPTIKQLSPGYSFPAGIFIINSNPELQPETNDAWELGAGYSRNGFSVDAAVFDNKVKNLVDTRFERLLDDGVQEWTYDNIDSARLRGFEISTQLKLKDNVRLNSGYQYLDAKDGDQQRLEGRPRHTLSAALEWEKNGWLASIRAEHQADQVVIPPGSRTMVDLPETTLWNVGLSRQLSKNFEFRAGIENLTNLRLEEKSSAFRHEEYPRTLRLEVKGSF
jgi:outer membrane receptor for ferrienterochelin and colicins